MEACIITNIDRDTTVCLCVRSSKWQMVSGHSPSGETTDAVASQGVLPVYLSVSLSFHFSLFTELY